MFLQMRNYIIHKNRIFPYFGNKVKNLNGIIIMMMIIIITIMMRIIIIIKKMNEKKRYAVLFHVISFIWRGSTIITSHLVLNV